MPRTIILNLPMLMEQGGIVSDITGSSTATADNTEMLLGEVIIEGMAKWKSRVIADVPIKDYRRKKRSTTRTYRQQRGTEQL